MFCAKTFKIRISENYRDEDEALLNDFLESVVPQKIDSDMILHPVEPYWSVLVIYSPREDVTVADGERLLFDSYEPMTSEEEILFMKLKLWRDDVARKENLPSHLILHNAHLMTLAKLRPTTEEEFKKLKGLSERKLGKYSEAILRFFRNEEK